MTDNTVELQRLAASVETQQRAIETQQRVLDEQQRSIERLARLIEEREAGLVHEPAPTARPHEAAIGEQPAEPGPVDWLRVSGPQRLVAWQGLARFVETLIFRYNMQLEVRGCWWRHSEAVEELTALWHMRQVLYRDGATLRDAMMWQDNFYKSRDRLRYMFAACGDYHVDSTVRKWMTDAERMAFVEAVRREVLGSSPPPPG